MDQPKYISSVIPPDGQVDLSKKKNPICEQDSSIEFDSYYVYTRAKLNTTKFKEYLQSLPHSIWEDKNQVDNVNLIRPAHDKWGIKKIIFTFCDDFLQKVFDLPWSQKQEWRQFLSPIYESVGINEKQVVRSLLASMPPGVSIPVHHDTGYWVKRTHRLHVPLITSDLVDFLVGPTPELLKKYQLREGHVVELNNQAKHAVYNNTTDLHRVHLIFDYVELDFALPRRVLLRPGERVHQTRRSIDLASDQGKRQTPSFIIIGSQKCGTTSLYEYLCHHPLVVPGGRRETHFFDWRWNKELKSTTNQRNFYMNFFDKSTIDKNPSLVTGESTPSYLLHSDIVIPRMQAICPWTKVLIILRNPVDRAYSQYQMCVDLSGTPAQLKTRGLSEYINKTFDQVIDDEINYLLSLGITPTSSYEDFKRLILPTRPLTHGGHSILIRGLYALQLEPWLLVSTLSRVSHTVDSTSVPASTSVHLSISVSKSSDGYGNRSSSSSSSSDSSSDDNESGGESSYTRVIENSSDIKNIRFDMKLMSISDLKGSLAKVQSTMDDVYEFVGLPSHELTTQDVTAKNTRDYIPMSPAVRARLEEFYEPYNQRLRSLLSEYGLELGSSW